jgi:hypothetical protein
VLCDLASRRVWRYSIIDSLLTARVLKDPDAEAEFAPKESIEYEDKTESRVSHCGRFCRDTSHFSEHALQLIAFVDSLWINTPILGHNCICIEAFTALPVVRE